MVFFSPRISSSNTSGTHTHTTVLWLFGFCPGQPGWAVTRRNIHPLTLIVVINHPYLLSPSTTTHGILCFQSTCSTVFFHNLSPSFLWSTSWPGTSTLYSIHFFTQSLSSFRNTCPYHRNLFCFNPSLILVSLSTLCLELYLAILISALWSATSFSFLTGQVSLRCNILLRTQLPYNLPLAVNDMSLLVSNGTECLNLFHPIQILVFTAAAGLIGNIFSLRRHCVAYLNTNPTRGSLQTKPSLSILPCLALIITTCTHVSHHIMLCWF